MKTGSALDWGSPPFTNISEKLAKDTFQEEGHESQKEEMGFKKQWNKQVN